MTAETRGDAVDLLLVERPHDERRSLADAFGATDASSHRTAADVEGALEVLSRDGADSESVVDIVVTNLAPAAVFDLLEAIGSEPETARTPVLVVLDASDDDAVTRCYDLGANACLDRASDPARLVSATEAFWFSQAKLPRRT